MLPCVPLPSLRQSAHGLIGEGGLSVTDGGVAGYSHMHSVRSSDGLRASPTGMKFLRVGLHRFLNRNL